VLPSLSARPLDSTSSAGEPTPRKGFVQRTLLAGTALGLGVTIKPPSATDTLANGFAGVLQLAATKPVRR
jgi:hypothetical protein